MLNMNVMCVYALSAQLRRREQRLHCWKLWLRGGNSIREVHYTRWGTEHHASKSVLRRTIMIIILTYNKDMKELQVLINRIYGNM
jgi:hypothetical protein